MQAPRRSASLKAEAPQNLVSLEERVEELVQRIKPNHLSDRRRKEVGNYVKDLIKRCFLPAQQVCSHALPFLQRSSRKSPMSDFDQ